MVERVHGKPDDFWHIAAQDVRWIRRPRPTGPAQEPSPFAGGMLNLSFNALDRHVIDGHGDEIALIHQQGLPGTPGAATRTVSYAHLLDLVARCAGVLTGLGVQPGEQVLIRLPPTPEAVVAMLACARIGAVHGLWGGQPEPPEAVQQRWLAAARVLISDGSLPRAATAGGGPGERYHVVVPGGPAAAGEHDLDWSVLMRPNTVAPAGCAALPAHTPAYRTLTPDEGGPDPSDRLLSHGEQAVALRWAITREWSLAPGQVCWSVAEPASPFGHVSAVYGPLLAGASTVLVSGMTSAADLGVDHVQRICAELGVQVLCGSAATIRQWRGGSDRSAATDASPPPTLRAVVCAGQPLPAEDRDWVQEHLGCPVQDTWWSERTGWPQRADPTA